MSLDKHVYVEKPMAHTFSEFELMIRCPRIYRIVTQMRNQGHSEAIYFQFKAWKDAGITKAVTAIIAYTNNESSWHKFYSKINSMPPPEPLHSTLDWGGLTVIQSKSPIILLPMSY
jgi:predicted dehydrogenase